MGNKNSTGSEPSLSSYSQRDLFAPAVPIPPRAVTGRTPSPPFPKRSFTISERQKISDVYVPETPIPRSGSDATSYRSSPHHLVPLLPPSSQSSDSVTSDELSKHIQETTPGDNDNKVSLGAQVSVTFGKDIKTVAQNKLFEISCDSIDPALNPIKGYMNYDSRQLRAEFTPSNTFLPNTEYTVVVRGRAVTTTQCSQGANIKDFKFHFRTCNPSPKNIGIKLKGNSKSEPLQIASYYDLYNSLILWCTKKWGCSGEHITYLYSEKEDKPTLYIKGDLDVLNVDENEVIVVEIKD